MNIEAKKPSPCKVNLMLAITNPRPDGFHDLLSLVAPTKICDTLSAKISDKDFDTITCNLEGVPCNEDNLVIKAAILYRNFAKVKKFFDFDLQKIVPHGAGLGGGSSNGAVALQIVNELCGNILTLPQLEEIAAQLGSDCPLFLTGIPIIMRGRGEKITQLNKAQQACVESLELLIFKPDFGINTGWAYAQLRSHPENYIPSDKAEEALAKWLDNPTLENLPLINNMQIAAFEKYPALALTLQKIKEQFDLPAIMTGSGSACFAIVNKISQDPKKLEELKALIRSTLGDSCFMAQS